MKTRRCPNYPELGLFLTGRSVGNVPVVSETANPPQGGDAKPRGPQGQPGYRTDRTHGMDTTGYPAEPTEASASTFVGRTAAWGALAARLSTVSYIPSQREDAAAA